MRKQTYPLSNVPTVYNQYNGGSAATDEPNEMAPNSSEHRFRSSFVLLTVNV